MNNGNIITNISELIKILEKQNPESMVVLSWETIIKPDGRISKYVIKILPTLIEIDIDEIIEKLINGD